MPEPYAVDLSVLDGVIAELARFESDARALCRDVDALVERLHVSWTGSAASAHRAAHVQWSHGVQRMHSALATLRGGASIAHENYSSAVGVNKQMWLR